MLRFEGDHLLREPLEHLRAPRALKSSTCCGQNAESSNASPPVRRLNAADASRGRLRSSYPSPSRDVELGHTPACAGRALLTCFDSRTSIWA
jgi:hypothetical protein